MGEVSTPTRLTQAERRQRTRELLVSAAMKVFARSGYAGASVDAIAAQAGFTVGALYSNFATKEELFLAAFEQHCAEDLAALRAQIETTTTVEDLMAAVTERFGDLDEHHRERWQLWGELWLFAQRHESARRRMTAVQDETRVVIAQALSRAGAEADDEVVALVHALWTGFMMYRLINPDALGAAAFGRAVQGLLAGSAGAEHRKTRPTKRKHGNTDKEGVER